MKRSSIYEKVMLARIVYDCTNFSKIHAHLMLGGLLTIYLSYPSNVRLVGSWFLQPVLIRFSAKRIHAPDEYG
jgi:hypothetical protein